jgi:cytochrome c553
MFFFAKKNQKTFFWLGGVALAGYLSAANAAQVPAALTWAYPLGKASVLPDIPPGINHVRGSTIGISKQDLESDARAPDWFPASHPPAPPVVATADSRRPMGCANCHFINGQGFPGNADLAGLPAPYIIEQVHAFQSGRRHSTQATRTDTLEMIKVARSITDAELTAAARYFAALPNTYRFDVVETATVPQTQPDAGGWQDLVPGGHMEPIAGRIIEIPRDALDMEREDPTARMVVYVPPGAIPHGAALARGGNASQPCSTCHGKTLQGSALAPRIAGRSAAYTARMLWDIKTGARAGPEIALMRPVVARLNPSDIRDLAAYLCWLGDRR